MLTRILLLTFSLLFFSATTPTRLTINISDLKNSKGQLLLEFTDAEKNVIKEVIQEIENNACIVHLTGLAPGTYSFKYFHDENSNKKLDTNLIGMPKEGFGFSNNAKGTFGPPAHEKTLFEFKKDTTLSCTPIYLKKK